MASYTSSSYAATSYVVDAGPVITLGGGHHDGMSQLFRPREILHAKVRVGLLFSLYDITPDQVISRIEVRLAIIEHVRPRPATHLLVSESRFSKSGLLFWLSHVTKAGIQMQITDIQPTSRQYDINIIIQEKLKSSVLLSLKINDEKVITKQYAAMTGNPFAAILANSPDLTDQEALAIALIFEDGTDF